MVQFPTLLIAAIALVATCTRAAPLPQPLEVGHVVLIAPSTTNSYYPGTEKDKKRPHIVVGKDNGKLILAPVTHSSDPKSGPLMKPTTASNHPTVDAQSYIGVHHVTMNDDPSLKAESNGAKVDGQVIDDINKAKQEAAVHIYKGAEAAHKAASTSHTTAKKRHEERVKELQGQSGMKDVIAEHKKQIEAHDQKIKEHQAGVELYSKKATAAEAAGKKGQDPGMTFDDYKQATDSQWNAEKSKDAAQRSTKDASNPKYRSDSTANAAGPSSAKKS